MLWAIASEFMPKSCQGIPTLPFPLVARLLRSVDASGTAMVATHLGSCQRVERITGHQKYQATANGMCATRPLSEPWDGRYSYCGSARYERTQRALGKSCANSLARPGYRFTREAWKFIQNAFRLDLAGEKEKVQSLRA